MRTCMLEGYMYMGEREIAAAESLSCVWGGRGGVWCGGKKESVRFVG